MQRHRIRIVVIALLVAPTLLWTTARAGAQVDPQRVGEYDISSFVTDDVRAITNINLKKIDIERTQQWAERIGQEIEPNGAERQQAMARLGRQFGQFESWVNYMKEAGAEQVYILHVAREDKTVPVFVVPGIEQEQLQTIKTLLTPVENDREMPDRLQAARIRDAAVLAPPQLIQQLQQPQAPTGRAQELLHGLQQVEGAAIRITCTPDPEGRRAMREIEHPFAQEDLDGVQWMAFGIDYPEQPDRAFKMILQAEDSQTAERVKQRWNQKLQEAADDDDAQLAAARLAGHRDALEAEVEDNRVTITLSNEQANKLLKDVLVPVAKHELHQRDDN